MLYTNYFIEALKSRGQADILLFENNRSVTAGQLLYAACSLATGLLQQGVKKGDKVVIVVKPGITFLQIIYASMMLGNIISIIDPEMGRDNYAAKFNQFSPDHAFVDGRLLLLNEHPVLKFLVLRFKNALPNFPHNSKCKLFTTGKWLPVLKQHTRVSALIKKIKSQTHFEEMNEESDFLVTYTSGTVSEPKAVVHSYRGITNSIKHLVQMLHSNKDEIIATHLPHYALLGINAGIKVHIWNNLMKPAEKIRYIIENKITTLLGPPSDFVPCIAYLKRNSNHFPDCIRNIYLGSAPVYSSFLSRLIPLADGIKITCLYGMTENLLVTFQDGREKLDYTPNGDLVGRAFPNVTITIEKDGEVCIYSNQLYTHYWQQNQSGGIHYTGDIGSMDDTGRLILSGRKKDMVIRGNFNIYPGLYEPTINKIKGVKEAVMIGVYNIEKADEEIVLVIDSEIKMNSSAIMRQLSSGKYSIDKAAIPDKIVFMKIPHSGRQNKVNRTLLANQLNGLP
ncbi:MAG TPA: class I adenylate-forming enzyme family protein [Agriterribacter sp.]|nr:class I adenylate-forming enzyme family protein [Agriterribacter sp.]HRQ49258.1 class I adenylate-forming enzyme family protein [Agriterribacter sp.]